jgi:hypothetical protein
MPYEYEPSPKKIREAEEAMESWQAAATRARFEIMSHAPDLEAVGVTPDQIKEAAELAGERAREEFEQKEKEDPYRRIAKIIEEAAETPEEQKLAEVMVQYLERNRTALIRAIQKERAMDKTGEELGTALEAVYTAERNFILKQHQNIVEITPSRERAPMDIPRAFVERVLRRIGALGKARPLDSLESLPEPQYNPPRPGPCYDSTLDAARNLPTIIDGVELDIYFKRGYRLWVKMNMEKVRQVINFPESE